MTISVVLRLVPAPLDHGELVGHVQIVETGESRLVAGTTELVAFLRTRVLAAAAGEAGERG